MNLKLMLRHISQSLMKDSDYKVDRSFKMRVERKISVSDELTV